MRTLTRLALGLAILGGGCEAAIITPPGEGGGPMDLTARERFERDVEPRMDERCASCHTDRAVAPDFMVAAGSSYARVLGHAGLVRPGDPDNSRLLTKGMHNGPAWEADDREAITEWILLEMVTGPDPDDAGTARLSDPHVVGDGMNAIRLSSADLPGAEFQFMATRRGDDLELSSIRIWAGGGSVSFRRPRLLIGRVGSAETTLDGDRFMSVEGTISSGTSISVSEFERINDFPTDGTLAVRFDSAMPL